MWNFIVPAATALMGAQRANRQADQKRQHNLAQAEITKYSPWTGIKGQLDSSDSPSALEGLVSGGIQGAGIVQGLGLGKATPTTDPMASGSGYSLGGSQMANQMGQDYSPNSFDFGNNQSPWMMASSFQKPKSYFGN